MLPLLRRRRREHDAEQMAAAYLNGELRRVRRSDFELHLTECDECWREVVLARRGRVIAESGRELAPARLRETVRARIETLGMPRRGRFRWVTAVALLMVATVVVVAQQSNQSSEHDIVMAAAVTEFREGRGAADRVGRELPQRVGQLRLVSYYSTDLGDVPVVIHGYEDPFGRRARVYQGNKLPMNAEHGESESGWLVSRRTEAGFLLCLAPPVASIIIGDDVNQLHLLAAALENG